MPFAGVAEGGVELPFHDGERRRIQSGEDTVDKGEGFGPEGDLAHVHAEGLAEGLQHAALVATCRVAQRVSLAPAVGAEQALLPYEWLELGQGSELGEHFSEKTLPLACCIFPLRNSEAGSRKVVVVLTKAANYPGLFRQFSADAPHRGGGTVG